MKNVHLRTVLLVGAIYIAAGFVFGWLAGQAGSILARNAWRWAAWAVSAVAFGIHIVYEHLRLRSSHPVTALNAAMASGIGAFGLAAMANIHAMNDASHPHSTLLALSLVIWPVMTAIPAFLVALVAVVLLARMARTR